MEVKPTAKPTNPQSSNPGRTGTGVDPGSNTFLEKLHGTQQAQTRATCDGLLRQIDAQAEELKRAASPEGLKRYRELVTTFMKEALGQSYQLDQQTHWDRSGNRKNMVVVKKIDDSLEELMELVVGGAQRQLELVAKLDQIRGLLLDVIL